MAVTADDFQRAYDVLAGSTAVLCLSHTRPDGDAIGSVLGLRSLLRGMGKEAAGLMLDPPTGRYEWLSADDPLAVWTRDEAAIRGRAFDAVVVADTAAARQLEPVLGYMEGLPARRVIFDHHATRDLAADAVVIDESAAATCELIWEWADATGMTPSAACAEALFVGLATDTGWFRFPSVTARTLRTAECLVARGANPHVIYERLYRQESPARLRLTAAMLETLELRAGGRLAVVELTREAFARCGATPADTEELVNEPARIGGVEAVLLFVEQDDPLRGGESQVRVSFRSKPPAKTRNAECGTRKWEVPRSDFSVPSSDAGGLDVAALAAEFGGGGHARAAGARIPGSLPEVRRRVLARVESEFHRVPEASHDSSGLRTQPT